MNPVRAIVLPPDDDDLDPEIVLHFELEEPEGKVEVTYDVLVELLARIAVDADEGNRKALNVYRKIAILLMVNEHKRGRGPLPKSVNLFDG